MKSTFETMAYVWLTFSIIAGLFIWHLYDCRAEDGAFFIDGDSVYWFGYVGEIDYE